MGSWQTISTLTVTHYIDAAQLAGKRNACPHPSDGTFQYSPNANFVGNDQFTYKINDGLLDSNLARVTFVVQNVNDAPVASSDAYTTNQGRPLYGCCQRAVSE